MIDQTARHAGHADIIRETSDSSLHNSDRSQIGCELAAAPDPSALPAPMPDAQRHGLASQRAQMVNSGSRPAHCDGLLLQTPANIAETPQQQEGYRRQRYGK